MLLGIVLGHIAEFEVDDTKLGVYKSHLLRRLANAPLSQSSRASKLRLELLKRQTWSWEATAAVVDGVTVPRLKAFVASLPDGMFVKVVLR